MDPNTFLTLLMGSVMIGSIIITGVMYAKYMEAVKWFKGFTVFFLGKDKKVRLVKPKVVNGQFLDLGKLGKVMIDPTAVYRFKGFGGDAVFVYADYARAIPGEVGAFASKVAEDGVEGEELTKVEVDASKPQLIKWHHVKDYLMCTNNPEQVALMVDTAVRLRFGKQFPLWAIVALVGGVATIVIVIALWAFGVI